MYEGNEKGMERALSLLAVKCCGVWVAWRIELFPWGHAVWP
jgi:hypothetical protein